MNLFRKKSKDKKERIVVRHSKDDIRVYRPPVGIIKMERIEMKKEKSISYEGER